ncbi:MAG TPA: hypothetical protein VI877_01535 [Dehalococcoidia bacterium]|nr:hypothetical protein [Dehalococcoidia bacterium]
MKKVLFPAGAGLLAALGLVGLYFAVVALLQDRAHAVSLLWQDRYFVAAIASGFGTQMGLYTYLRQLRRARGPAQVLAGTGTGTSSLAMVACCLHHASDVLPLIGLSGAAIFLSRFRIPFMALGLAMNLAGIAVSVRILRRARAKPSQD